MAKNKNNAKPKASRYNVEMAEEAGTRNLNVKNSNNNVNDQTNK